MLKLAGVAVLMLGVLASVSFGADKRIDDLKALAGDWRSLGNVNPASIHINEDGTYQGIAATGAKTAGRISVTDGKASFRSTTSEGTLTFSEEGGKDVLTFVTTSGRAAKLERVK